MATELLNRRFRKGMAVTVVFLLLFGHGTAGVGFAQIVTDGQTQTHVMDNGAVTDITTDTIAGSSGINSFSDFNVGQDSVVNLHLPAGTTSLVNLVHGSQSHIHGILNAIKADGSDVFVGGDVYFLNPFGVVVGEQGVINVGSLTMLTPEQSYMSNFFSSPYNVNNDALNALHAGQVPISVSGAITVKGTVNAVTDVTLGARNVANEGLITSGAVFLGAEADFSDVVNVAGLESGGQVSVDNGVIRIDAVDTFTNKGEIVTDGGSGLDAGDITITAGEAVHLEANSLLSAVGQGADSADGDVTITVEQVDAPQIVDANANTTIVVDGATIRAGDISLSASSFADHSWSVEDPYDVLQTTVQTLASAGIFGNVNVVRSRAASEIVLSGGANLEASGAVNLLAHSEASSGMVSLAANDIAALGFVYGETKSQAVVDVGQGVSISGRDLHISASNRADLDVSVYSGSTGPSFDSAVAVTIADVSSSATIAEGATINLTGALDLRARNENTFATTAGVMALGQGRVGVAAAIFDANTSAIAGSDADLTGLENVSISADDLILENSTRSSSTVGSNLLVRTLMPAGLSGTAITNFVSARLGGLPLDSRSGGSTEQLKLAGAVTVVTSNHEAIANIGAGANVDVTDSVAVTAEARDARLQNHANTSVESGASDPANPDATFALSAAVGYGSYSHTAQAFIGEGATVAARELDVRSDVVIPYEITWHKWEGVSTILSKINGNLGVANGFLTGYANATGAANDVALVGSVSLLQFDNVSRAYVDKGVSVTLRPGTSAGSANILANTKIEGVYGVGNVSLTLQGVGGTQGGAALGGAYGHVDYSNVTKAFIAAGATVAAATRSDLVDISVMALSRENVFMIAPSAGRGASYGLSGNFALGAIDTVTEASVDYRAVIEAGRLQLRAEDDVHSYVIAGNFNMADTVSVGASIAFQDVETRTRAFIGDNTSQGGGAFGPGSIDVEELSIDARTDGVVETISVAGSVAASSDPKPGDASTAKAGARLGDSLTKAEGATGHGKGTVSQPSFGLGIAGSASVNTVTMRTTATIDRSVVNMVPSGAGRLSVVAVNDTHVGAFGGAASVVRANASTSNLSVAMAGSLALNIIDSATEATVTDSTVTDAGDIAVYALAGGEQLAIALGAAVNVSDQSSHNASIAGSVSINTANNRLTSTVHNSTLLGRSANPGNLTVVAYNRLHLGTGGGSLIFGGRGGVGAAISYSDIANSTQAVVRESTVSSFDDVSVRGLTASRIGAGAGVAAVVLEEDSGSLAGAFVISDIDNDTLALVEGSSIEASGDVSVDARDVRSEAQLDDLLDLKGCTVDCDGRDAIFDFAGSEVTDDANPSAGSSIVSVAGVVQAGRNNVGISLTMNTIGNTFRSSVIDADIHAGQSLDVSAFSNAYISGWALGVGAAEGFGAAGSVTVNAIRNDVVAELITSGGHAVSAANMSALAQDRSHILSVAGQITIGKNAAVGGAVAINEIENTAGSHVTEYELDVPGTSDISAWQASTIDTFAVSGAGSDNALVGSVAISEIGNTTVAELAGARSANEQNIVTVLADNEGRINTLSGGAAFGGANGVGAAVSVNRIGNLTRARVHGTGSGTQLDIADLLVRAQSLAQIESMAVGLGVGGQVGVAGSAATNFIDNETESYIDGGAHVLAQGNVGVIAESHDVITNAAGAAGIGFEAAGVSGSVGINQIGGHTRAYIADNDTSVTALALLPNRSVRVIEGSLTDEIKLANFVDMEAFDPTSNWRPLVPSLQRTEDVRGVAVNAAATHSIVAMAANVAAGTGAGLGGTTSVTIVKGLTEAYVHAARINDAAGAGAAQQLVIRASDHAYSHGLVGSLGIGGGLGIGAAANTNVFTRDVKAALTDTVAANARDRVVVDAQATQGVSGITIGAAGGAAAAVGTANVALFSGDTVARVSGANITTGGLHLNAHQSNRLFYATPAVAIAAGAGFAGTASVASMTGATRALLDDSDVAADGHVSVAAASESEVDAWSIGVAASGGFSVAGNAVVNVIERATESRVSGATIGAAGARANSLSVTASDDVSTKSRAGAVGIALTGAGVGAGAVVTSIANDTSAIVDNTQAFVSEDVLVDAGATRDVSTSAASAGVGAAVGIGGVAAVTLIGEHLSGDLLAELDVDGEGTLSEVESVTNDNRLVADGGDGEGHMETGHALSQAELDALNAEGRTSVREALTSSASPGGISAVVGANTVLDAGRDVTVRANEQVSLGMTAGAVAASGGMSIGGSVGVTRATLNVSATVHGDAHLMAGRDVDVAANAGALGNGRTAVNIESYQGSAGAVTLGAAVADARLDSHVTAVVGAGATIETAQGNIRVSATDDADVRAHAEGYVAGVAAAGIVLADAVRTGTTDARIGTIGHSSPSTNIYSIRGNIAVTSLRRGTSDAFGRAGAGGVVAGGAVEVNAREEGASRAIVGDSVVLTSQRVGNVGGALTVDAESLTDATATARGYSGALFANVGFSSARATVRPTVAASIGSGGQIKADTLTVRALADSRDNRTMAHSDTEAVGVGAIGFSGAGTTSRATTDVNVSAQVGSQLHIGGAADVTAAYVASQEALASGVVAGLAAAGGTFATTDHQSDTAATLADTVSGTVGGDLAVNAVGRSNSYARSTSGSGGIVSGAAAGADTDNVTSTRTELGSPSLIRAGSMTIGANHTTTFNSRVSSINASIAGKSGATANHNVNSAVDVLFRNGSRLSTDSLTVTAFNESRKAELDGGAFNAQSGSGGIVDAAAVSSRSTIDQDTNVLIGNGSNLMITGDWDNPGQVRLSAVNDIFVRDKTKLDAGGAIEIAEAASHAQVRRARARVTIGNEVAMDVAGVLQIGVRTGADIHTSANAKTYGGAGSAAGRSTATISTENTISIGQDADLRADGDIVLQAGQDLDGRLNTLSAVARTDLFNKTAIPVRTSPRADADITYENWIDIGSGALVRSVGDISLLAPRGSVRADGKGTGKDLYREILNAITGAFKFFIGDLSLSISGGSSTVNGSTYINVDGLVHAGIQNKQRLIFDTYGNVVEQSPDGITFTIVEENLATTLHERLLQLLALRSAYHADPDAYGAYTAEINLIMAELSDLGLLVISEDESGELVEAVLDLEELDVRYIVIDDVKARGGDITVTADHLGGQGNLRAPYDTEIVVHNPSDMFLRTNRMLIEDRGGHLYFNGVAVSDSAGINSLNTGNRPAANLDVEAAGSSDVTPSIDIRVTGNPNVLGSGPIPDIEITGDIVNLARGGTIDIYNQYGSILLRGPGDQTAPGVSAEVINLDAGRNIVQAYRDGFVYIGADPKTQWMGETSNSNTIREGTGSYIAGNMVFLSARYLLINGLIQSGIPDWSIELAEGLQTRAAGFTLQWLLRGRPAIASAADLQQYVLEQNERFTAYFNPETQQIILDDVKVQGGYVELYGEILNTGGGKIAALDGFGQITVDNELPYDLVVGALDTGNIAGVVRITDTAQRDAATDLPLTTVFQRINGHVSHEVWAGDSLLSQSSTAGRTAVYNPRQGLRYEWVTGREFVSTYEGYHSSTSWFEFIPAGENSYDTWTRTAEGDEELLPDGEYTRFGGGDLFQYRQREYELDELTHTNRHRTSKCNSFNFFGFCVGPRTHRTWDTWKQGVMEVYTRSLQADHPIPIEFIGYDAGDARAAITISSLGDVLLTKQVENMGGAVSITTGGSIIQMSDHAYLRSSGEMDLAAAGSIGSDVHALHVRQAEGSSLSAEATSGNVYLQNRSGGLTIARVHAGSNVSIDTFGDIVQLGGGTGAVVAGQQVTLVSQAGSIGSATEALNVDIGDQDGAGLRATAARDISFRQVAGDLRLFQVESLGGDVTLEVVDGSMFDVNTDAVRDERTIAELTRLWDELMLLGAGAEESASTTVAAYANQKQAEFHQYWTMRGVRPVVDEGGFIVGYTADPYVPDMADAELRRLHDLFGDTTYDPAWTYTVSAAERAELTEGVEWTLEQLTLSLDESILFKDTGSTETEIRTPNVIGRNVTLIARAGNVGEDSGAIVIDVTDPDALKDEAVRIALAAAEPDDIGVDGDIITVLPRRAINVQTRPDGELIVEARDHAYIGSRSPLYVKTVASGDSIRIKGTDGLYSVETSGMANVTGGRIILEGGLAGIGTVENPLLIGVTSNEGLTARAEGDIFLQETLGNLYVAEIFSRGLVDLHAFGSIVDVRGNRPIAIQGHGLNLYAGGDIGTVDNPLLFTMSPDGRLDAEAGSRIVMETAGTATLGNITLREDLGSLWMTSAGELRLLDEVRTRRASIYLTTGGSLTQTSSGRIIGNNLTTLSNGEQQLGGANQVFTFTGTNQGNGALRFVNDQLSLNVYEVAQGAGGDISITNSGSLALWRGVLTTGEVTLSSTNSSIRTHVGGRVTGASLLSTTSVGGLSMAVEVGQNHSVARFAAVNTGGGSIEFSNDGTLEIGDVMQTDGGAVEIVNSGDVWMTGAVETIDSVTLTAIGSVTQAGGGRISRAALFDIRSVGGQTLWGDNTVATFRAHNEGGEIRLRNAGALTLVDVAQADNGDIDIENVGNVLITGVIETDDAVKLMAVGRLTQSGSGRVQGAALLHTRSVGGQALLGDNTVATLVAENAGGDDVRVRNLRALTLLNVSQADGGNIDFDNIGDVLMTGVIETSDTVTVTASGSLVQSGAGRVHGASLLDAGSVGGQTLLGGNTVASLLAINDGGGDLNFNNVADLTVLGMTQTNTGHIMLVNVGDTLVSGTMETDDGNVLIGNIGDLMMTGVIRTPGTVLLTVDGRIIQDSAGRIVDASLLQTESVGGQTLAGDNTVASFVATNVDGGDIDVTNSAVLTVLGITQTDDGNIVLVNVGDILVSGTMETDDGAVLIDNIGDLAMTGLIRTPGPVLLTVDGRIIQSGTGRILDASLLQTASVGGQTLTGDNTVASLVATNESGGDVRFVNTYDGLTLGNALQAAQGDVFVNNVGDIRVQKVASTRGDVHISVIGSLVNGNVGMANATASSVDAVNVILSATGGIGTPEHFLYVDSSNERDGVVRARAAGGIYLWETAGDLRVDEIESYHGDIGLVADGSIVNRGTAEAVLRGATIDARAFNGTIGEVDRRMTVTATDSFNAIAWGDMFIGVPVGDLVSDYLESENGRIDLFVADGSLRINTVLSPFGVDLRTDRVDITNLVHTGTAPLRLNVSGLDGLAASVNVSGRSAAGVVFDYLGAEEAYIDIETDHLALEQARIERRGEFGNNGSFVIAENVEMKLFEADLQIYPRDYLFYLIMGADRSILTDALIVNYNDDYIINYFHTENSGVRATEKLPGIVGDTSALHFASGMLVPRAWWLDPESEAGADTGADDGTLPTSEDETQDELDGTEEGGDVTVAAERAQEEVAHIFISAGGAGGEG